MQISSLFNKNIRRRWLDRKIFRWRFGNRWVREKEFARKEYRTYRDYLMHQKLKLRRIELHKYYSGYDVEYRKALGNRLAKANYIRAQMNVLCLGARLGTEVKAFQDLRCFAIGIDINPGKNNKYVLYGDFHNVQFPDGSLDAIFTNSLDHVYDIKAVISEIIRLLKSNGLLIIEAVAGSENKRPLGLYESFSWQKVDDLVGLFEKFKFRLLKRFEFDYPWPGEHLVFSQNREYLSDSHGDLG
jgi:SAM-dependent methyltransferase